MLIVVGWSGDALPANPVCDELSMTTRQVRLEGRVAVDDYYEALRAAEARIGDARWTNTYESVAGAPEAPSTYLSLSAGSCGHQDAPAVDPYARALRVLGLTYGSHEAGRLLDRLGEATVSVTVQGFRTPERNRPIPWRELGAPFVAITPTESSDLTMPAPGLRLVAVGSPRVQVWMRPVAGPVLEAGGPAGLSRTDAGTEVFRFRAELSSRR